ncbi:hypothetical protein [Palleronia sp.]|uniref:hypothetical protein n=1 Tax=Palleronia sp. TaxID=1940284 RepID=UPI0035C822B5
MLRLAVTIFTLMTASLAQAGGLCVGAECGGGSGAAPVQQLAPRPNVAAPDPSVLRQAYESVTGLWKADANGTCIGTLGAYHLTPYYVIAEGEMFEIASITGTTSRIAVLTRRVNDGAGAQFIFMPVSRKRLDVAGTVFGESDQHLGALRRCRRGME